MIVDIVLLLSLSLDIVELNYGENIPDTLKTIICHMLKNCLCIIDYVVKMSILT